MKQEPRIELDTAIIPHAVAEAVHEEAAAWLDQALPRRWIRELIAHANTVYARNERFRREIRAGGNRGRDHLWMFMRHWLAALLHDRRPRLHSRLPALYNIGSPPPPKPDVQSASAAPVRMTLRIRRQNSRRSKSSCVWAAAAHFHSL